MPLPAYLTEQPKINPTDVLARQIRNLGLDIDLVRTGSTITVRNLELDTDNHDPVDRALRLMVSHADANGLSIDAIVYSVQGNIISRYQAAGFEIHINLADEDIDGAHTLLRRQGRH